MTTATTKLTQPMQEEAGCQYAVATGDFETGIRLYGPFETNQDACFFANTSIGMADCGNWQVIKIRPKTEVIQ